MHFYSSFYLDITNKPCLYLNDTILSFKFLLIKLKKACAQIKLYLNYFLLCKYTKNCIFMLFQLNIDALCLNNIDFNFFT